MNSFSAIKIPDLSTLSLNKYKLSVLHNFDLSIILFPFEKNTILEKIISFNAHSFQRNGIEIIIIADQINVIETLNLVHQYPLVSWKVITISNSTCHNYSEAINIAVNTSSKRYVMMCHSGLLCNDDIIYDLRYKLNQYMGYLAIGGSMESLGCLMLEKSTFKSIGGYDASFNSWKDLSYNLAARLSLIDIKRIRSTTSWSLIGETEINEYEQDCQQIKKKYATLRNHYQ